MSDRAATVIATFSRRMHIAFPDGSDGFARIKGKTITPVCGDIVRVDTLPGESDWLISGIEKRRNALSRPSRRGAPEVLAANVDVLVAVAAASPVPDWFIVDRYLCAAEVMRADAILVFNKVDEPKPPGTDAALSVYANIAYPIHCASATTGEQVDALLATIGTRTAILVGQSGVGKSSLINLLSAPSQQKTAGISRKSGEGRHTTVNSIMLPLPGGGAVIDSPGVRDYAPALAEITDAEIGFREIAAAAAACRFADCRHLKEPDCAVKSGVDSGTIDARRYESYRRVYRLVERLQGRSAGK
jgi:ribosome biogenesis GTPase / thiamine phosphate phosphatase